MPVRRLCKSALFLWLCRKTFGFFQAFFEKLASLASFLASTANFSARLGNFSASTGKLLSRPDKLGKSHTKLTIVDCDNCKSIKKACATMMDAQAFGIELFNGVLTKW